jgi:hypothetical protein
VSRGTLAAAALSLALLAGCVPASPDVDTYDDKAALTLGAGISEARTVQRILETLYDGRMLRPTAKTQLRYSEDSLDTATGAFTELNPPPARDPLSTRTATLMSTAGDLMTQARVAIERDRVEQYPTIADDLGTVADRMEKLEGRLS